MRVDRTAELTTTQTVLAEGLVDLSEGRWDVSLTDGATTRRVVVEKRVRAMAIKVSDRWYGIRQDGTFSFFVRDAAAIKAGSARAHGCVDYSDDRLRVEFSEGTASVLWSGSTPVEGARVRSDESAQRVLLKGTAYYSFLDGPTRTPLRIPIELVGDTGAERSVILPAALTTHRGRLRIPLRADGTLSYQATEGTSFKVDGHFDGKTLALVIETAGTIGWTRKELSGVC